MIILLAPLNCGKITFCYNQNGDSSQKYFVYLSLRKQKPLLRFNVLSEQNSALIYPIMRAFDGGLDSLKRLNACVKERVLENDVLQRSRRREFTMHLRTAQISLHLEKVVSLRSRMPLPGLC